MRSGAVVLALTGASNAQDLSYSPTITEACEYAQGSDGIVSMGHTPAAIECIGVAAQACMIDSRIGGSTAGMSACFGKELDYWDARLNNAYSALMERLETSDAEMSELGSSAPKQVPALRDMQRAWITFRDAKCDFERSNWGGGTGGGPATLACLMQETAEQAFHLESQLGEG
ncbi:DUF1311 domain-containing protein [Aliiroseovarius halocynthiae]|uniref:DUF1311 domain-containing protein n=1 Tax=Aliiroseovarius halocynthiae TaxID=985055 RepID=A0A545SX57_9RHOB|nr:DUF1311 domain-containing protein [Aliiroseovarius halocynthiae]